MKNSLSLISLISVLFIAAGCNAPRNDTSNLHSSSIFIQNESIHEVPKSNFKKSVNWYENFSTTDFVDNLPKYSPDYRIIFNSEAGTLPQSFQINDLKTYEKKILHIKINHDTQIKFEIPTQNAHNLKVLSKQANIKNVNFDLKSEKSIYIELFFTKPQTIKVPIENNLLETNFILEVAVQDSGKTQEDVLKEIGFQEFATIGLSSEDLAKEFGPPLWKSTQFPDGSQTVIYAFPEYNIEYHLMLRNNTIQNVQLVER